MSPSGNRDAWKHLRAEIAAVIQLMFGLLQIGADNLDHVVRRVRRGLRCTGHVVPDVILEQFLHQAIDRAPGSGQPLKNVGARRIFVKRPLNRLQLSHHFPRSIQQVEFFPRKMRHGFVYNTLSGYRSMVSPRYSTPKDSGGALAVSVAASRQLSCGQSAQAPGASITYDTQQFGRVRSAQILYMSLTGS